MKGYTAFLKTPALLEPHNQIVWCHIQDTSWMWGSYPSAEKQSVYSTAPADWATEYGEACDWKKDDHIILVHNNFWVEESGKIVPLIHK